MLLRRHFKTAETVTLIFKPYDPSEGWKEKSKPARVLIVASLAILSAVLMRRFSRCDLFGEQRVNQLEPAGLAAFDEIGYLPVAQGGGNLFFQLVNARYEKGAMS